MRGALIHRARLVGRRTVAGPPNVLGEVETEEFAGPWIRARVMERGSVAAKGRRSPETTAARVERGYEVLLDFVDLAGAPVAKPTASAVFETECAVLGNPTVHLSGEPEVLTNGVRLIGYLCHGDVPKDRS